MKRILTALALAGALIMSNTTHAQYADAVLSYESGTGFVAGYTNANAALGLPALGSNVNPMDPPFSNNQLVSIGAGGEITLQMNTPILNNPADPHGLDFIVFANSFFVSSGGTGQNETTTGTLFYHPATVVIQVSADDENWYTLNPTLAPQPGEWFPTYGGGSPFLPVNPSLTTTSFAGLTLGQIESLYAGSAGGTGYALSWAQDASGNSVDLASVDYLQIDVESGVLDLDAVTAVPEPSVYALLLAGASLLGFGLNRSSHVLVKKMMRVCVIILFALLAVSSARAVTFTENFTNDPAQNGWQIFGDTNLFQWDPTNDVMNVTWDSPQPNSYFYHPLGTTLWIGDSFTVSFDIQLTNIQWSEFPALAVGLLNFNDATNSSFSRPDATTPNLFEFDYYPDSGDLNNDPNVTGTLADMTVNTTNENDFYFTWDDLPMNLGTTYHVTLTHTAWEKGLTGTMCTGGQVYTTMPYNYAGPITDFRLDTLSINSYEDDYDPLYAQGTIGHFVVTLPPYGRNVGFSHTNGVAELEFGTYPGWNYMLERSTNLISWTNVTPGMAGNGDVSILCDTNPPRTQAFYRVSGIQP